MKLAGVPLLNELGKLSSVPMNWVPTLNVPDPMWEARGAIVLDPPNARVYWRGTVPLEAVPVMLKSRSRLMRRPTPDVLMFPSTSRL